MKCQHPAGCALMAEPGEIYCAGCATDPALYQYEDDKREPDREYENLMEEMYGD